MIRTARDYSGLSFLVSYLRRNISTAIRCNVQFFFSPVISKLILFNFFFFLYLFTIFLTYSNFLILTGKMAQGMVFEDIFNVKDIDPNGKQFDRGK